MGDVYEGMHELIGKKLAIKCMHQEFAENTEAVERFKREARAATAVGNEHVVDVSDMGDLPDGSPFIVMEYLDGRELADLIAESKDLPVHRVINIALQVLEALQAVHDNGVVHRDMKPENIFLVKRGGETDFVKVLDFGISMIAEQADALKGRMTQTGVAMGTPNYMSPEQARGARDVDERTDLYSVGVILYQALTNILPFDAGTLAVMMTKILTETPASICQYRSDVPEALDRIILRCMAKEADIRFESAEELADALRPFSNATYQADESFLGNVQSVLDKQGQSTIAFSETNSGQAIKGTDFSPKSLFNAGISTSNSRRPFVIASVLAIVVIGVFFVMTRSSSSASELTSQNMAPAILDKPNTITTIPEPIVKEVKVAIETMPPEAKVYLNGKLFPTGVETARPRSLATVRIEVVLEGYQAIEDVTVFDKNRFLEFSLQKNDVGEVAKKHTERAKVGVVPPTSRKRMHRDRTVKEKPSKTAVDILTTQPKVKKPKESDVKDDRKKEKDSSVYTGSSGVVREDF